MRRCWRGWMRGSTPRAMRPGRPSGRASPRSSACFGSVPTPFAPEATTLATVTPRALVRLEGAVYSVWTRWAGLDLVVRDRAPSTVTIVGRDGTRVHHPRKRFGERSIDYRHYLTELARKPQAVRQVLPDLLRDLGAPFPAIWDQLHGGARAARGRAALRQGPRPARHPGRRRRRARADRRARDGDAAAARAHAGARVDRSPRAGRRARAPPRHRRRERLCGRLRRLARRGGGMSAGLIRDLVVAQTRAPQAAGHRAHV